MQNFEALSSAIRRRRENITHSSRQPARSDQKGRAIHRWAVYKQLCIAKNLFGLNDRNLAVLSSLLSFFPEDAISEQGGIIVFPSNKQLSLRAHGMPESTLRRHLSALIEAGLIERQASPNGKRYAHKNGEGAVELAFGFSVAPLLQRANDIQSAAERVTNEIKVLKLVRDKVSIARRELSSLFQTSQTSENSAVFKQFRSVVDSIPRRATLAELKAILSQLEQLRDNLNKQLNSFDNVTEMSGNDAQIERQHKESLTESLINSTKQNKNDYLISKEEATQSDIDNTNPDKRRSSVPAIPLDIVLKTCPDIVEYAPRGIKSWRDFIEATKKVSSFLGIAPSAYTEAIEAMGIETGSSVIAWLLQRIATIQSAGGYLRSLTTKVREGGFSMTALLMYDLKTRGNANY